MWFATGARGISILRNSRTNISIRIKYWEISWNPSAAWTNDSLYSSIIYSVVRSTTVRCSLSCYGCCAGTCHAHSDIKPNLPLPSHTLHSSSCDQHTPCIYLHTHTFNFTATHTPLFPEVTRSSSQLVVPNAAQERRKNENASPSWSSCCYAGRRRCRPVESSFSRTCHIDYRHRGGTSVRHHAQR